jgi:PAS domain S-box-containing protein
MSLREETALPGGEQADQRRVDLALETARIGTWEWDPLTDRVEWSENFERLHGFENGAFGSSLTAYARNIHSEDRDRVAAALRACAEGGPDYRVEYRLLSPGGVVHYVEASGRRISDRQGMRLIGVCRDVSDRVALLESERAALRDAETSELYYRTLAATIPQQVWTARPGRRTRFRQPPRRRLFRTTRRGRHRRRMAIGHSPFGSAGGDCALAKVPVHG